MPFLLAAAIKLDPSLIVSLITIAGAAWAVISYVHKTIYLLEKSIANNKHEAQLSNQKITAALMIVEHRLKCLEEFQEETSNFRRLKCNKSSQTGGRWLNNFIDENGN